jgi:sulfide:quinone oxidoreductase
MKLSKITPCLSVSDQLTEQDLGTAAAHGFKAIINNRPDGEAEEQPPSEALAATAERLGLGYRHIPVVSGMVTDEDAEAFAKALGELTGPVLAFCRTGTRSTILWALSEAGRLDPDTILKAASEAGCNLAALRPRLEARSRSGLKASDEDQGRGGESRQ